MCPPGKSQVQRLRQKWHGTTQEIMSLTHAISNLTIFKHTAIFYLMFLMCPFQEQAQDSYFDNDNSASYFINDGFIACPLLWLPRSKKVSVRRASGFQ